MIQMQMLATIMERTIRGLSGFDYPTPEQLFEGVEGLCYIDLSPRDPANPTYHKVIARAVNADGTEGDTYTVKFEQCSDYHQVEVQASSADESVSYMLHHFESYGSR